MQVKTTSVAKSSGAMGLDMQKRKGKTLKHNTENTNPITLDEETLELVGAFKYLGITIDKQEDLMQI
ncbi:unnamed protein product [Schistosoma margrebowiei]|uniref:Uncharacterized protein n=1 Tax=Schistosoma margrebowiei TaxID=48269 RepID=A0A183MZ50_9TREM|nr:unnamed protein product [Schistosoma margrebowiei]